MEWLLFISSCLYAVDFNMDKCFSYIVTQYGQKIVIEDIDKEYENWCFQYKIYCWKIFQDISSKCNILIIHLYIYYT